MLYGIPTHFRMKIKAFEKKQLIEQMNIVDIDNILQYVYANEHSQELKKKNIIILTQIPNYEL